MSRRRVITLSVIAALLLLNVIVFFTYRVRQQERIRELTARKEALEQRLAEARAVRGEKDRQLALYKTTVDRIARIHQEEWATPQQRLVPLILELRSLAQQSRLIPRSVNYAPSTDNKNREITTIDISFGVEGTYRQARHLIHLIEQSEQFVYIDSIGLNGREGDRLQLNLVLKTLFRVPAAEVEGRDS